MNLIQEVSQFIDSKVQEEIKKSHSSIIKLFEYNPQLLSQGCLITGSKAKEFYGFTLPHPIQDLDLVLINEDLKDIYLLANSLIPKHLFKGSFGSIIVQKPEEIHYKAPIASFCSNNQFVEVF